MKSFRNFENSHKRYTASQMNIIPMSKITSVHPWTKQLNAYLAENIRLTADVESRRHLLSSTTTTLVVPPVQRWSCFPRRCTACMEQSTVCYDSATQTPQLHFLFPEKLLKIVVTRGEIFSLNLEILPPYELEGFMGCDITNNQFRLLWHVS